MSFNRQIFYINSRNRATGTNENFTFTLTGLSPTSNYTHASVLQCTIPKSYYLVQDAYNTFTLDENGTLTTITIPSGNYTRRSFQTVLQTTLRNESPNGWTYTVSYANTLTSSETGKYSYAVSGNGGVQPSFIFTTNIYEQMGFDVDSTNAFVGDALTSANVIKLEREDCLYLHCDMITNGNDSILQELFAGNQANLSSIYFTNPSPLDYSKKITLKNGNTARFHLTNEDNQTMNLNGQNMVISLLLFQDKEERLSNALSKIWG